MEKTYSSTARAVELMRNLISGGEFRAGQRLPPELDLAEKLRVSRPTLRNALDQLTREGIICAIEGNGRKLRGRMVIGGTTADGILSRTIVLLSAESHLSADPHGELGGKSERAVDAAIGATIRARGHHFMSASGLQLDEREEQKLIAGRPAGFLATETVVRNKNGLRLISRLAGHGFPVVTAGSNSALAPFDRVYSDHSVGAYEITRWLIQNEKKNIAIIGADPLSLYWVTQRYSGYQRAMEEAGLEPQSFVYIEDLAAGDSPVPLSKRVRTMAAGLLEMVYNDKPADAIVTLTDWEANIAFQALQLMGKRPNQDILLAGYDNLWETIEALRGAGRPAVTMDKENIQIGEMMVKVLLERIDGKLPAGPQARILHPRLIVTP